MKVTIVFSIVFVLMGVFPAQARDPFESYLPQEEKIEESLTITAQDQGAGLQESYSAAPGITIQGVLWGDALAKTIINGKIYSVGDLVEGIDAKVYKIEKNNVFVLYDGRLYKMSTAVERRGQ